MLLKTLKELFRRKPVNPMSEVAEPPSNVGTPVGGKHWYKAREKRVNIVRDPGAPQHTLD